MKKAYFSILLSVVGLLGLGQSQPNNVDVGLFLNGAHGSNAGSGAYAEVAFRIKPGGAGYGAVPLAENLSIYLMAPKSDFSLSDVLQVIEVNAPMYGGSSTTQMTFPGAVDVGANDPDNWYFPVLLNVAAGLNLTQLSPSTNNWVYGFTFNFAAAKPAASYNKLKLVDQNNNSALSAFAGVPVYTVLEMQTANQLTATALMTLPVSLLNFSGYKSGSKNVLKWTTASEQNNVGFEVQRSSDGVNYSAIAFVNSLALGGNSGVELSYTFDDNSPVSSKKNFYRLKQKDIDGRSKTSNVVLINGEKPTTIGIGGIFPNPASSTVNVIIDAPRRDDVTLVLMDVLGKTIKQKVVNVEIGSNTVPVEIGGLASGSYLVKVLCKSSDCETAVSKFIKH